MTTDDEMMATEQERQRICERAYSAVEGRLASGRPVHSRPFGCRLGADGFLEASPDELAVVRRAHELFAENGGEGGSVAVRDGLKAEGKHLPRSELAQILRDPCYVNGQVTVSFGGAVYPMRPVDLPIAVPPELSRRISAAPRLSPPRPSESVDHAQRDADARAAPWDERRKANPQSRARGTCPLEHEGMPSPKEDV